MGSILDQSDLYVRLGSLTDEKSPASDAGL